MLLAFLAGDGGPSIGSPETFIAAGTLMAAVAAAWFGIRQFGWWERPLARLARRKKLAILVAALAPLALRALLLPWFPAPEPRLHDEFSFLLEADTIAHGRLANPQHQLWVHFENVHILVRPTYASAFPIAQGASLAIGKVLFGHPWAGVWLSAGFMCGAICWMLQGWLPPRWALLGAVLVILRLGVSSYWMNSYWGGFVAAAGGALVLGALPRIIRTPHWGYATTMGGGLAILANSRTFEGAWLGLLAAIPLFTWMFGTRGPKRGVALRQLVLPLGLVVLCILAGLGYSFARVTGKPWVAPYTLYRETMSVAPHFLWQSPTPPPPYNNREIQHFFVGWEMNAYRVARNQPVNELWTKINAYWRFYLGPLLSIPLATLPLLWRRSRMLLMMAAGFSLALVGQVWHNVHYAAPAAGLAILIVVLAMRGLRLWRWRQLPVGLYVVRCLPQACAVMLLVQIISPPLPAEAGPPTSWRWPSRAGMARANILRQLESSSGKHLVLVRYDVAVHDVGDEWVYNGADIDGSKVIWARELDSGSNAKLLRYFGDRQLWLMEPDLTPPRLTPYREAPPRLMPFVQIGAPGIESLRSADDVKRKVLERADSYKDLNCDGWNYLFTQVTGVEAPEVSSGCYLGNDRNQPVSFEQWFTWLQRQR
ncbi:MAG: hypothetical protein M3O35_20180 [Acidobacteriota bacterium]|nr:hypothetical protein [Acidobacteriota bacterium]